MMDETERVVEGVDVPIVKLTPLKKRSVSAKDFVRLKANLQAVGLIEPLCVYREDDAYYILDGYIRYKAFLELGVETVPCLIVNSKDIYTHNRQVNNLTHKQEIRMLRKALEKLDEKTIAAAFGIESLSSRLSTNLYKEVDPAVAEALNAGKIQQQTARELTFVSRARQCEILKLMEKSGDWSLAFAKTQVLKTPPAQRIKKKKLANPWDTSDRKKRDLVKKLSEVESQYDFYSGLYREYVSDLLKLVIYVRQLVTRPKLLEYLEASRPDAVRLFREVMAESEGRVAG